MIDKIYIHFADYYHLQRAKQNAARDADIIRSLEWSFRLAILFSREVVFPASSIFESARCRELIAKYPEFRINGKIRMAAGDANLADYLEGRAKAYDAGSPRDLLRAYSVKNPSGFPSFDEKRGSSTAEIQESWVSSGSEDLHFSTLRNRSEAALPSNYAKIWNDLPNRLGHRAFVSSHAMEILLNEGFKPRIAPEVDLVIEEAYIRGYAQALNAHLLMDVPFLAWRALELRLGPLTGLSFQKLHGALVRHSLDETIGKAKSGELFKLATRPEWEIFTSCVVSDSTIHNPQELKREILGCLEPEVMPTLFVPQENKMNDEEELRESVRTAILTALPVEFAAVQLVLPNGKRLRVPGDPNVYYLVTASEERKLERPIVVCMLPRAGNESSAAASASLHRSFCNIEE